jgi:crotonobetaine/carnitine-CoA ligase
VVKRPEAALTESELCDELAARMTRFMVPRYVEFVERLPKTQATERIVKGELRRRGVGPRTWDRERQGYADASSEESDAI